MNILICGANGFVGRHLAQSLRNSGHRIIRGVRRPTQPDDIAMDYCTDTRMEVWLPRLADVSVVVNVVGVLRDRANKPMAKLHDETPQALFSACAESGVERIVHISALGVGAGIDTPYFNTRQTTETSLSNLPDSVRRLVLRPSLIYGQDGASARMLRFLASLPLHIVPAGSEQPMQPVHIDDICHAVALWLSDPNAESQTVAAVGLEPATLRELLDDYRMQLHRPPAFHLEAPAILARLAARMGDHIPSSPLCSDTLTMLLAGNSADKTDFSNLLGRPPKSYRHFIKQGTDDAPR